MSHLCATQRFAEPRDYPDREPAAYCRKCGKSVWDPDEVVQTATGTLIGECCNDELRDDGCPECGEPVLTCELEEHLTEDHGFDADDAKSRVGEAAHA